MKNIFKNIMTIQTIMFPLWSFKHINMQFWGVSTHLGGSFDYVFTHLDFLFKSHWLISHKG
jgi:hypothetical protein